MPAKRSTPSAAPPTLSSGPPTALKANASPLEIAQHILSQYLSSTPQRTMLLDAFMGFLGLVAAIQFVYCVLVDNFPFNAFLSGFCACVGQFVLTASLRMQTTSASGKPSSKGKNARFEGEDRSEKDKGKEISHERAFADFIFGSLILHFFCINFIN